VSLFAALRCVPVCCPQVCPCLLPSGVLLLVDSVEGPMPQTRFVTKKALALNKKVCYHSMLCDMLHLLRDTCTVHVAVCTVSAGVRCRMCRMRDFIVL
jgi:hypothetical protein